jgi:hypothetical protein
MVRADFSAFITATTASQARVPEGGKVLSGHQPE